ncbi:hypothetical protein JOE31_001888 [Arthrobacter sp. PvP023]|uniref:hypothetical protein n=1 Tax=Micrococcaceae TaxID=1268 RepID=UPI001AEBA5CB|nr:hypothetical protein [Arthrobacter sp. PvP023]MBP1135656.1 hypothetical protein [Arthrobacter sp. PvP023]
MNTAMYYPLFYPSESWLRMASLLWERVYVMHTDDAPRMSASLDELDEALGGVLEIVKPWDTVATVQKEIKVPIRGDERWDKALQMYVAPTRWEKRTEERSVRVDEVTDSNETVAQFASWLDLRSELLSRQMEESQSDMAMLSRGKLGGGPCSICFPSMVFSATRMSPATGEFLGGKKMWAMKLRCGTQNKDPTRNATRR